MRAASVRRLLFRAYVLWDVILLGYVIQGTGRNSTHTGLALLAVMALMAAPWLIHLTVIMFRDNERAAPNAPRRRESTSRTGTGTKRSSLEQDLRDAVVPVLEPLPATPAKY